MNRQSQQQQSIEKKAYIALSDITVGDSDFRAAESAPYDRDEIRTGHDVLSHQAAGLAARQLLFETLVVAPGDLAEKELQWELSRKAALARMSNIALGSYADYFSQFNSESKSEEYDHSFIDADERVIATNGRILGARRAYDEPVEFLDSALGIIERRKRQDRHYIGPENYATSLKFFADKYANLDSPSDHVELGEIKPLVDDVLKGFFDIARTDTPNVVEMTNIYSAIRVLPRGSVDEQYTRPLIKQSLESLPDFSAKVTSVLLSAIPKLKLGDDAQDAAELVNLALRKGTKFESTIDLQRSLRAISCLPPSVASEKAFEAVMNARNNLENSLDLNGVDEIMDYLRKITNNTLRSQELTVMAKQLAATAGKRANAYIKQRELEGTLVGEQALQIRDIYTRITSNYRAI